MSMGANIALYALLGIAALIILFVVAPAAVLYAYLTHHRNPEDFDKNPARLTGTQYEKYAPEILADLGFMRNINGQTVEIYSDDGLKLKGEYIKNGSRLMIFAHGFSSTPLNNFASIAKFLYEQGWSLLFIIQRGHGISEGCVGMGAMESQDIRLWAKWAENLPEISDIAVYGMSMGGAALILGAGEEWPSKVFALIADCAYYNMYKQMRVTKHMDNPLSRALIPFIRLYIKLIQHVDAKQDGLEQLRRARLPMFFAGGGQDKTISADDVKTEYEACQSEKRLCIIENAAHTLCNVAGKDIMRPMLIEFLDEQTRNHKR